MYSLIFWNTGINSSDFIIISQKRLNILGLLTLALCVGLLNSIAKFSKNLSMMRFYSFSKSSSIRWMHNLSSVFLILAFCFAKLNCLLFWFGSVSLRYLMNSFIRFLMWQSQFGALLCSDLEVCWPVLLW